MAQHTKNKAETLLEELIMRNIVRLEDDVCYITENGYNIFEKEYTLRKLICEEAKDFKYLPKKFVDHMIKLLNLEDNKQ